MANLTWKIWVDNGTAATTTNFVWDNWNDITSATTSAATVTTDWIYWVQREHLAEVERVRKIEAQRKEESERAAALLNEHLTETQRKQLKESGEFEVESQSGKRYAIQRGYAGNVFSLDAHRKKIAKHCIHPIDNVPDHDAMLAQLLWLKWNEAEFLKVANTTPLAA